MEYAAQMERIASLIRENPNFYALTGAGMSTESGIPDFRSPGTGLWEKIDPLKTSSAEVLYNDPRLFYEVGFTRFPAIAAAEPNPGHFAMARLEELGYLKGLVTQNIDGLHVKAGSRKVWEVHGHLRSCHCSGCKKGYPFEELVVQVGRKQIPPACPRCLKMLRPDVILFGDPMPEIFFEAESVLSAGCDLLLVAGSSLVVYPVAYLPRLAKKLIIINLEPTDYDIRAEIVVREKCGKALSDLVEQLTSG
jgi:NAD-dependent deacetylase